MTRSAQALHHEETRVILPPPTTFPAAQRTIPALGSGAAIALASLHRRWWPNPAWQKHRRCGHGPITIANRPIGSHELVRALQLDRLLWLPSDLLRAEPTRAARHPIQSSSTSRNGHL